MVFLETLILLTFYRSREAHKADKDFLQALAELRSCSEQP